MLNEVNKAKFQTRYLFANEERGFKIGFIFAFVKEMVQQPKRLPVFKTEILLKPPTPKTCTIC